MTLRILPAPRSEWLTNEGNGLLTSVRYTVSPDSNRVAIRLAGPPLLRRPGELPSEGTVIGGVQVPADGQPLIFLADHPTTVGYPVVAIVAPDELWQCAQLRPGAGIRFVR
jgi:allophanate hydrolase subunit 2